MIKRTICRVFAALTSTGLLLGVSLLLAQPAYAQQAVPITAQAVPAQAVPAQAVPAQAVQVDAASQPPAAAAFGSAQGSAQFSAQAPMAAAATGTPADQIKSSLQNILNNQAARGQYPSNNAFLTEVQQLITKYSNLPKPKVKVINNGPGVLRLINQNGTFVTVNSGFQMTAWEVGPQPTRLEAQFQNANITFENAGSGQAKFWDQDDQRHTPITAASFGPPQQHKFTLTPGVQGYQLEQ